MPIIERWPLRREPPTSSSATRTARWLADRRRGRMARATKAALLATALAFCALTADAAVAAGTPNQLDGASEVIVDLRVEPSFDVAISGTLAVIDGGRGGAPTEEGRPYSWGGASPQTAFDEPGLTQWSYQPGAALCRAVAAILKWNCVTG